MKYLYGFLAGLSAILAILAYMLMAATFIIFVVLVISKIMGWYAESWLWVFLWPVITGVGGFIVMAISGLMAGVFAVATDEEIKKNRRLK